MSFCEDLEIWEKLSGYQYVFIVSDESGKQAYDDCAELRHNRHRLHTHRTFVSLPGQGALGRIGCKFQKEPFHTTQ